ncbi:S9 family peptidase [Xenophilus sp. Marseille-Q4582]|uniref:alpha/beta hydrolase family protein n=1 Tax=Xenophilus sp. Marseille-Q4582 TaxID=2866600 RepID=UPI001CE45E8D|nr:alpha/beta hydrolase [Xenophilus sp. Marseille-Q4582]
MALLAAPLSQAHALMPPEAPLPWSQPASRADCPDADGYLWLPLDTGDVCLRYFASAGLQGADTAIVYFTGDRDRLLNTPPAQIPANTAQAQTAAMDAFARQAGLPVVMLARPGTYGSSGDHRLRRRLVEEFVPLAAGVDLLQRRHGIRHLVLWGHSGGATAVAALLTLGRQGVRCAVMTSPAFDYLERWRMNRTVGGPAPSVARGQVLARAMYDPLAHVAGVAADPARAVHVMGDPRDKVTPFVLQAEFVQALQAAGHRAQMHQAQAAPPMFHNLREQAGLRQAAACARGG